jgi:hypothetical protein
MPAAPATHYIFVDFENVQSVKLDLIAGKPVMVIMVIGKDQTKVPLELVEQLMTFSSQVRLVRTEVKGKNALDFVLSAEVGAQGVADPNGSFHIISRDKGFDALVAHFRSHDRSAARHDAFVKVPILSTSSTPATPSRPAPTAHAQPAGHPAQIARPAPTAPATRAATPPPRPAATKSPASTTTPKKAPASRKPAAPAPDPTPDLDFTAVPASKLARFKERIAPGTPNRPKTTRALRGLIKDKLGARLSGADIEDILHELSSDGSIVIASNGAISYPA